MPRLELRPSLARKEQERDISSLREQPPETPHMLNHSPLSDMHPEGPRHQGHCPAHLGLQHPQASVIPSPQLPSLHPPQCWQHHRMGHCRARIFRPARSVFGPWEEPLEPLHGLSQTWTLPGAGLGSGKRNWRRLGHWWLIYWRAEWLIRSSAQHMCQKTHSKTCTRSVHKPPLPAPFPAVVKLLPESQPEPKPSSVAQEHFSC